MEGPGDHQGRRLFPSGSSKGKPDRGTRTDKGRMGEHLNSDPRGEAEHEDVLQIGAEEHQL
eukprot:1398220-Amphidinium_carterae.1